MGGSLAWRCLRKLVQESWDLPFAVTPEGKILPGPERLTGADRVLIASVVALLRPGSANGKWARETYFAYLRETRRADFEPLGIDTQSGEILFILCCGYDWLVEGMDLGQQKRARKRLFEVAEVCRAHLDPKRRDYAQAHYLGCGLGLLAFSFLFWEDHPKAAEWAAELRGAFDRVLAMLPEDGSSEGRGAGPGSSSSQGNNCAFPFLRRPSLRPIPITEGWEP